MDVISWRISVSRVVAKLHRSIRPFLELSDLGPLKRDGGKIELVAAARARIVLLVEHGCHLHVTYLFLDHKVDGSKFTVPYAANY